MSNRAALRSTLLAAFSLFNVWMLNKEINLALETGEGGPLKTLKGYWGPQRHKGLTEN